MILSANTRPKSAKLATSGAFVQFLHSSTGLSLAATEAEAILVTTLQPVM